MLKDEFGLMMLEIIHGNIIKNNPEKVMTLPFLSSCYLAVAVLSVFLFPLTVFFEWQLQPTEAGSECPSNQTPSVWDSMYCFAVYSLR